VRFSPKSSTIVIVADGLSTIAAVPTIFQDLGQPQSAFQVPDVAVMEYENYSVLVQVTDRRVTISDKTGISGTSLIPIMMSRLIAAMERITVKAVGFNFWFDGETQGTSLEIMREYVNAARFEPMGTLQSIGLRVGAESNGKLVQLNIDPVFRQDSILLATVNYHFQDPEDVVPILDSYRAITTEAPEVLERVFNDER
jgi:hypothetical protein